MNRFSLLICVTIIMIGTQVVASPVTELDPPVKIFEPGTGSTKLFRWEFFDNNDSPGHNSQDGFLSIQGKIGNALVAGGVITAIRIDWNVHNDMPFTLEDAHIAWEFSDAVDSVAVIGNRWKTMEHNALTEFPANMFTVPTTRIGDIPSHMDAVGAINFTAKDPIPVDSALGVSVLAAKDAADRQKTYDVLFNRSSSVRISDRPQSLGRDEGITITLFEAIGKEDSDASVFFNRTMVPIPEPSTFTLLGIGVTLCILALGKRHWKKPA